MKRMLLVLLAVGLVMAPAAAAKGPHAIFTAPREPVEPGKPWRFTIELNEFRMRPDLAAIGRLGARTVGAEIQKTPSSIPGAAAFRVTMIFPRRGAWRLRLFAGHRRFALPAVHVGSAQVPRDYVAFPVGSPMEGQAGEFSPNAVPERRAAPVEEADDGGIDPWLLPLLGMALAGAGVAAVTRRGWR